MLPFQLLYQVGGFGPGKSVLIHAGGSGVGLAATQLAREGGASAIFVTAGSQVRALLSRVQLNG